MATDELDIVLKVQGFQDAMSQMSQFATNASRFSYPNNQLQLPGSSGNQSGALNTLRQRMGDLQSAIASGNESDIVDALAQVQDAVKGVQKQASKLQGLDFGGALQKYDKAVENLHAALYSGNDKMILDAQMNLHQAAMNLQQKQRAMMGINFSGPNQQIAQWQHRLQMAQQIGDPALINDAQLGLGAAQQRLHRLVNAHTPSIIGPAQALQQAQSFFDWAQLHGNDAQKFDAQWKLDAAQARYNKASGPKDPWSKLLFGFGLGGNNQGNSNGQTSLANRVFMNIGGIGGQATSIGSITRTVLGAIAGISGPAMIAATAITGFAASVMHATRVVNEFATARGLTGGTTEDIAELTRGYGLGAGQAGSLANSLRRSLFNDPMAIMASNRLGAGGMRTPVEWGGDPNSARILREHISALRAVKDESEQLRLAMMLHLEGILESIRVSEFAQMGRDLSSTVASELIDPKEEAVYRDLGATWESIQEGFGNFITSIGNVISAPLVMVGQLIAMMFNGWATIIDWIEDRTNFLKELYLLISGQQDKANSAADKMNNAANTMMKAADAIAQPGIYGGGPRVKGALPSHLRGEAYARAVEGQAMQFGAFVP